MITRKDNGIGRRWGGTWNRWMVATVVIFVHLSGGAVWAQKAGRVMEEDGGGMLAWGIAVVIGVVVCASAFINPKRTHLDK